tara:strand:- start:1 stop:276 length:276 start_codon:yes stop_codon:yes gene_type:complete
MNSYEEITDDQLLCSAINTYQVVIIGRDYIDIIEDENGSPVFFFIDVVDLKENSLSDIVSSMKYCVEIFEKHEHYEKCADITEFLKQYNLS